MTWKRSEIRQARRRPLEPLLAHLGYRLSPIADGNFRLHAPRCAREIIVKEHYWHCLDDGQAGNAIDFLVKIHGCSFTQAMQILCEQADVPKPS